jgi:hypothetical protein
MNNRFLYAALLFAALYFPGAALTPAESEIPLRKAGSFAMGGVGYAGSMSAGERALRKILKAPNAVAQLESMIPNATPAGKLYGLLGLRARDRAAYARALEMCRATDTKIETAHGCIIGHESFRDLVKEIDRGGYDALLAREWPDYKR